MANDTYWRVINAVKEYIEKHNGRRPSIEEIMEETGIKSTSTVAYHILGAVENGDLIEEAPKGQARRIGIPQERE